MRLVALFAFALGSCGCERVDRSVLLRAPSRDDFSAVSSVLERRCGGLDCHGQAARSLRIFGFYGLRLDGRDVPGGADTTELEIDANYEAVVSIDPERLSRITADGGRDAEHWLVLSKAREREAHVGGARLTVGAPADTCVTSWLAGGVDLEACAADDFAPLPKPGETW
jgi:hypothetical protein